MNQFFKKLPLEGCQLLFRAAPRFEIDKRIVSEWMHIAQKDAHVFRGYYDINYLNKDMTKHLVHVLPKGAKHTDKIHVGFFDVRDGKLNVFDHSSAWCWQQGARLRWYDDEHALFNDAGDHTYISRVVNLTTKKTVHVFSKPLYDININAKIGLSLNYARLQWLHRGYGYSVLEDDNIGVNASENDGIFLYDLEKDTTDLLLSLARLKTMCNPELSGEDYVNLIRFSPSGEKFVFVYIVVQPDQGKRVYLMCSDLLGKDVRVLEKDVRTSHFTWLDNTNLLTTYVDYKNHTKKGYRLYKLDENSYSEYGSETLHMDGHPTFITANSIVTDTYRQPIKLCNQYLFVYNSEKKEKKEIGRFYHDARFGGETRCDLHPSLCDDYLSVDSSCDGLRSVFLMKLKHDSSLFE